MGYAIYEWVARHIRYDFKAFLKGRFPSSDPLRVIRRRKAICGGYSALINELCRHAGLQSVPVIGYSKGADYRENQRFLRSDHVWNAMKVNGRWVLLDATWGSGFALPRKQICRKLLYQLFHLDYRPKFRWKKKYQKEWWDVHPERMVMDHLPANPIWQLQDVALAEKNFESVLVDSAPNLPQPNWLDAVEAASTLTLPWFEWNEGLNAKDFHPPNDFDLANGWLSIGLEPLKTGPWNPADSTEWKEGMYRLDSVKPILARWKGTLGNEKRMRAGELGHLTMQADRTYRSLRGDCNRIRSMKNLPKKRAHWLEAQFKKEASAWYHNQQKMLALPAPVRRGPLDSATQKMQEELWTQFDSARLRFSSLGDSVGMRQRELMQAFETWQLLTDSLHLRMRPIATRLTTETDLLFDGAEYRYQLDLDLFSPLVDSMLHQRSRWIQAMKRNWNLLSQTSKRVTLASAAGLKASVALNKLEKSGADARQLQQKRIELMNEYNRQWASRLQQQDSVFSWQQREAETIKKWNSAMRQNLRLLRRTWRMKNTYIQSERLSLAHWHQSEVRLMRHLLKQAATGKRQFKAWLRLAQSGKSPSPPKSKRQKKKITPS